MTCFMSIIGLFVFIFSVFTVGFSRAFKRFLMFIGAGFLIDILIIALSGTIVYIN